MQALVFLIFFLLYSIDFVHPSKSSCEKQGLKLLCTDANLKDIQKIQSKRSHPYDTLEIFVTPLKTINSSLFEPISYNLLHSLLFVNNSFTSIQPEAFKHLKKLDFVQIWANQIAEISSKNFDSLPVKSIDLSNNQIGKVGINAFNNLPRLVNLVLAGNEIEEIGVDTFINCNHLNSIDLSGCNVQVIDENAAQNTENVRSLSLQDNNLETMSKINFLSFKNLKSLNLNGNLLKTVVDHTFALLTDLEELILSGNQITTIESGGFAGLKSLRLLDLSYNPLSQLDLVKFLDVSTVTTLQIQATGLNSLDATGLVKILPNLREVSLNFNAFSCEDLPAILKTLADYRVTVLDEALVVDQDNVDGILCIR